MTLFLISSTASVRYRRPCRIASASGTCSRNVRNSYQKMPSHGCGLADLDFFKQQKLRVVQEEKVRASRVTAADTNFCKCSARTSFNAVCEIPNVASVVRESASASVSPTVARSAYASDGQARSMQRWKKPFLMAFFVFVMLMHILYEQLERQSLAYVEEMGVFDHVGAADWYLLCRAGLASRQHNSTAPSKPQPLARDSTNS